MKFLQKSCCFIGHRKIENSSFIYNQVKHCILKLINNEKITTFLFGSKGQFDDICLEVVTELKEVYPDITRLYVRAENEYISDDYKKYLLTIYDDTYFAHKAHNANRLTYIKRNEEMIDNSAICVFYYKYSVPHSGTAIAYKYARLSKKRIIEII